MEQCQNKKGRTIKRIKEPMENRNLIQIKNLFSPDSNTGCVQVRVARERKHEGDKVRVAVNAEARAETCR